MIGRGLLRAVPEILTEREERSTGEPAGALRRIDPVEHRRPLGARIALDVGQEDEPLKGIELCWAHCSPLRFANSPKADQLLAKVEDERWWGDRSEGRLEVLAVRAARARLAVDLQAEIELSDILRKEDNSDDNASFRKRCSVSSLHRQWSCRVYLSGLDPALCWNRWGRLCRFRCISKNLRLSRTNLMGRGGRRWIALIRLFCIGMCIPHPLISRTLGRHVILASTPVRLVCSGTLAPDTTATLARIQLGLDLAVLGWRRWRIATTSLLLADACKIALRPDEIGDPLGLSIAGTLAAFRGQEMEFPDSSIFLPSLDHVLLTAVEAKRKVVGPSPSANRVLRARELLRHEGMKDEFGQSITKWLNDTAASAGDLASAQVREYFPDYLLHGIERAELYSVVLYLLAPIRSKCSVVASSACLIT